MQRLQAMAGAAGPDTAALDALLEGDFDPAEYDKRMEAAFGDNYYDVSMTLLHRRSCVCCPACCLREQQPGIGLHLICKSLAVLLLELRIPVNSLGRKGLPAWSCKCSLAGVGRGGQVPVSLLLLSRMHSSLPAGQPGGSRHW